MYIEKLSIESFGSLSGVSYDLMSGVNIFHGKNESGKSTLAAFIKFIFYGLCGKTPDQSMSEKTRYTNWDHGISGGSLVLNVEGIRYRIERRVTPAAKASGKETLKVIDLASGTEVFAGKVPGEVFFGVGEEIFAQTAFSAQGSGSVVDSEKMNIAIDNMLLSGDESLNVKGALKKLDDARIFLLHKNRKGGKIFELGNDMEALEARIAKAREDETFLSERGSTLEEQKKAQAANRKDLKKIEDAIAHREVMAGIARFDDLDKKERLAAEKTAEREATISRYTKNGFLPSEAYAASLKALHADIVIAERERVSLARQKEAFAVTSLTSDQREILQKLDEDGGRDRALDMIKTRVKKQKSANRTGAVLAVFAFLFACLSVLLTLTELVTIPYLTYALYGATALFLVIAVLKFATAPSPKELFARYLADSLEATDRQMLDAIKAEGLVREQNSRYAALADELDALSKKLAAYEKSVTDLLGKWSLAYQGPDSLVSAADAVSTALLAIRTDTVAADAARVAYEAARDALKTIDRAELNARYAATAYAHSDADTDELLERKLKFCRQKDVALSAQIRDIELEIAARSAKAENLASLLVELDELKDKYNDYAEKYKAYLLAYESIKKAGDTLRSRIAPALSESASALMKASTQGRYADIGVDHSMTLSFRTDEASPSREVGYMSAGTKALTYISLRLSLIRLLFRGKMPPTVFDESFSWLDATRLASMMALLKTYGEDAQVIVMTCCDREYDAVADKSSVNLIEIKK